MSRRDRAALAVALAAAGCASAGPNPCDPSGNCPGGLVCLGGSCVEGGGPASSSSASSSGSSASSSGGLGSTSGGAGSSAGTSQGATGGSSAAGSSGGSGAWAGSAGNLWLIAGEPGGQGAVDGIGRITRLDGPTGLAYDPLTTYVRLLESEAPNNIVRQIDPNGWLMITRAGDDLPGSLDGSGSHAEFHGPSALAFDVLSQVLYVTDTQNQTLRLLQYFDFDTPQTATVAGAVGIAGSADGTGSSARFNAPQGLACDQAGHVFIADSANDTVRSFDISTNAVSTIAGAAGSAGSADGPAATARFNGPIGLAYDTATATLFIADTLNQTVRSLMGGSVVTLAGSPGAAGSADGVGTAARFDDPWGLALDGNGNLYVADQGSNTVRQLALASGRVTTVVGSPGVAGSADGAGTSALLNAPMGVAADGAGNLWIADFGNDTIRQLALATGAVTTVEGLPFHRGSADGVGGDAGFDAPQGLAYGGDGTAYVVDSGNDTIPTIALVGDVVTTVAGSPQQAGGADGAGSSARFNAPTGIASCAAALYVADRGSQTVRAIQLGSWIVSTLAGASGVSGANDGKGTAASFNLPAGLACDGAGNLFVADSGNETLRAIVLATAAVSTAAGAVGSAGASDGAGTAARFNAPWGLACDGAGKVFVADQANDLIRVFEPSGGAVTTIAGRPGVATDLDGTGTSATFDSPRWLAYQPGGYLYVAGDSPLVRLVDLATGTVTTVVGTPFQLGVQLDWDGPPRSLPATINAPTGLAVTESGLLIADQGENVIVEAGP